MAKGELTPKTLSALEGLNALGGSATLQELQAAGYEVGSANLVSLAKANKVVSEDVEVTYTATKTVKRYTVVTE